MIDVIIHGLFHIQETSRIFVGYFPCFGEFNTLGGTGEELDT